MIITGENPDHPRKIQLVRIAHVYYRYTDLEMARQFLLDFGFCETKKFGRDKIYFRGYGTEPWVLCATKADRNEFGGAAFVVGSEDDLRLAADVLPKASRIF